MPFWHSSPPVQSFRPKLVAQYGLLGCLVQRRTMLVRGTVLEMLAVEHPELVTLRTALQAMQLTEVPHTSSRTALRHLLGWPTHDGHLE
ncbi:MAG: hypothetical protein IPO52_13370 [Gemmatimonadetes bacterium]|nr:hypothetical protein [Gemmatimonadota bacterium]